jgi:hypothetical protein
VNPGLSFLGHFGPQIGNIEIPKYLLHNHPTMGAPALGDQLGLVLEQIFTGQRTDLKGGDLYDDQRRSWHRDRDNRLVCLSSRNHLSGRISYATSMSLLLLILTIVVFTILWRTARRLAE